MIKREFFGIFLAGLLLTQSTPSFAGFGSKSAADTKNIVSTCLGAGTAWFLAHFLNPENSGIHSKEINITIALSALFSILNDLGVKQFDGAAGNIIAAAVAGKLAFSETFNSLIEKTMKIIGAQEATKNILYVKGDIGLYYHQKYTALDGIRIVAIFYLTKVIANKIGESRFGKYVAEQLKLLKSTIGLA